MKAVTEFALHAARHVWDRMKDDRDVIPLGHDGYLKLSALSEPTIAADFILLDEAQQQPFAQRINRRDRCLSPRTPRSRLRRGREFSDPIPLAEGRYDRLPALASELVRQQVSVLAATTTPAVFAAKEATTTIPMCIRKRCASRRVATNGLARPSPGLALDKRSHDLPFGYMPSGTRFHAPPV